MRLQNAGVQPRLDDAGDVALLHVGVNMQGHGVWRQTIEMSTGIGLRTLRVLSGDTFRPVGSASPTSGPPAWKCTAACWEQLSSFHRNAMPWSVAAATSTCRSLRQTRR